MFGLIIELDDCIPHDISDGEFIEFTVRRIDYIGK